MNTNRVPPSSSYYGWYVVFINAVIGISMTAGFPQFSMIVGDLAVQMHTTEEFLLFTDTIKSLAIMLGMLLSGFFFDRFGLRPTFLMAVGAAIVPQFVIPFLTVSWPLIPLKVLQGLSALVFPMFLLVIMDWIKESQRGLATAIFNGIFYGGSGIGATFAGVVLAQKGWQASFYAIGFLTLIPGIVWLLTVREKSPGNAGQKAEKSSSGTTKRLLRSPQLWILILCLVSTTWMVQALTVDLPLWGADLGYDSTDVGLIMSSLTVGILLASLVSGRCSDYFAGRSKNQARARILVMAAGPALTIAAILLLFILDVSRFSLFYAAIMVLSFGGTWGLGAFYCILPELFSGESLTYATGFIGGAGDISMPLAPLVVGVIFGVRGLWTLGWGSCALVACVSLLACIFLLRFASPKASA